MNVIIVIENGVPQTPKLIKNNVTAEATFDNIAEELLGEDYEELSQIDYEYRLDEANRLLMGSGNEIHWFTDIEVNRYKN